MGDRFKPESVIGMKQNMQDPEKLGHRGGGNAGDGPVPDFHRDQFRPGNWKSEKLTVCTPDQIPRISEIQVFTRPDVPGVLPIGPRGHGAG